MLPNSLLVLDLSDSRLLRALYELEPLAHGYYVWIEDLDGPTTIATVQVLGQLFDALSELSPRTLLIPLLASAGWNEDRISGLINIMTVIGSRSCSQCAHRIWEKVQRTRQAASSEPVHLQILDGTEPDQQTHSQHVDQEQSMQVLQFGNVALGGTFDRLHAGHMLLLALTAAVCTKSAYVGITADELLASKARKHLLQPYGERRDAVLAYLAAAAPELQVAAGTLSDPKEPTQAELDPEMEAIVVSEETRVGADLINAGREKRGFKPLEVVVAPLVGCRRGLDRGKLSSTELREIDDRESAEEEGEKVPA